MVCSIIKEKVKQTFFLTNTYKYQIKNEQKFVFQRELRRLATLSERCFHKMLSRGKLLDIIGYIFFFRKESYVLKIQIGRYWRRGDADKSVV